MKGWQIPEGHVYDKVDMVSRPAEVQAEINQLRREIAFLRAPKQGELTAPYIISDTMAPVQSMLDGQMYDSKSELRKTYGPAGVIEVGDDPAFTDPEKMRRKYKDETIAEKEAKMASIKATWERAFSLTNLTTSSPGDDIKIKDTTIDPARQGTFHGGGS